MSKIPKRLLTRRSPPRVVSIVEGVGNSTPTEVRSILQNQNLKEMKYQPDSPAPIHISLSEIQRLPEEVSTELPLSMVTSVETIPKQESMVRTPVPRRPSSSLKTGRGRMRSTKSGNTQEVARGLNIGKSGLNLSQRRSAALSFQNEGTILAAGDLQIWRLSRKVRKDEQDDIRIHIEGNQGARITFHRGAGGIIQDIEIPPDSQPAEIVVPIGTIRFTLTGLGGKGTIPAGIKPGAGALTSTLSTRNRTFIGFQRNSLVHQIGSFRFLCRGVFIEADGTPSWTSFKTRNTHKALDVLSRIDKLKVLTTTKVRSLCVVIKTREGSKESLDLDLTGIRATGEGTRIKRKDGVAHIWPITADPAYSGPAVIEILTDENTDVHDVVLSTSAEQSVVGMLSSSSWVDLIEEGPLSPHGYSQIRWLDQTQSSQFKSSATLQSEDLRAKEAEVRRRKEEKKSVQPPQSISDKSDQEEQAIIKLPEAIAFESYKFNVSQFAGDHDEEDVDKLAFIKISGSDWLTIEPEGTIHGTPTNENVGLNQFMIRVTDPKGLFSDALVSIEVIFKELNRAPFWSPNIIKGEVKDDGAASEFMKLGDIKGEVKDDGAASEFIKIGEMEFGGIEGDGAASKGQETKAKTENDKSSKSKKSRRRRR